MMLQISLEADDVEQVLEDVCLAIDAFVMLLE